MRINGWQRLWLFASMVWAVAVLALAGILQPYGDAAIPSASEAALVVRVWLVPVVAVYVFGLGLGWVRRGFHIESK